MYVTVCVLIYKSVQITSVYLSKWRPMNNLGYRSSGATNFVFLRPYLLLDWSSLSRLDWLAKEPQGSICVYFPSAGITSEYGHIKLFICGF